MTDIQNHDMQEDKPTPAQVKAAMSGLTSSVFITFQKHGMHRYPMAPDEVKYLATEHRHLFKFRVTVEVFHDDREIEFHMLQNWIMNLYEGLMSLDYKSCEMIARDLMEQLFIKYGLNRDMEIEVNEDGENGATITYKQEKRRHPTLAESGAEARLQ